MNSENSELSIRHGPVLKVIAVNRAASLQVEKEKEEGRGEREGRMGRGGLGGGARENCAPCDFKERGV